MESGPESLRPSWAIVCLHRKVEVADEMSWKRKQESVLSPEEEEEFRALLKERGEKRKIRSITSREG